MPHQADSGAVGPAAGAGQPWTVVPERKRSIALARAGRVVLWGTVGLLALAGLRGVLAPHTGPAPTPAPQAGTAVERYPSAAAQVVAERLARAYLTWDTDTPEERVQALTPLLAAGVDPRMGWDGRGRQSVDAVLAGAVDTAGHGRALVRVEALVRGAKGPARWVALEVPVASAGGRVVVTGAPALVGLPEKEQEVPAVPGREGDPGFSRQTGLAVERFFLALVEGSAAEVTAPGATIAPLPQGVRLLQVQSWTADQGRGDRRRGTAVVTWGVGGGEITQTYRVELTRVSAATASRWQVADVAGESAA